MLLLSSYSVSFLVFHKHPVEIEQTRMYFCLVLQCQLGKISFRGLCTSNFLVVVVVVVVVVILFVLVLVDIEIVPP